MHDRYIENVIGSANRTNYCSLAHAHRVTIMIIAFQGPLLMLKIWCSTIADMAIFHDQIKKTGRLVYYVYMYTIKDEKDP